MEENLTLPGLWDFFDSWLFEGEKLKSNLQKHLLSKMFLLFSLFHLNSMV